MAVHYSDLLARILEDNTVSHRRDLWLWYWLFGHGIHLGSYAELRIGMRDKMGNFLSQNIPLVQQIRDEKRRLLLPEQQLEWLNEGARQTKWILSKFMQLAGLTWSNVPQHVSGQDQLILSIDLWPVDTTQKKLALDDLKRQWTHHKSGDKTYKWFKDNDEKSVLAWEWLSRNTSFTLLYSEPFEKYEDLLIFFDSENLTTEQKALYIDKIKKRWSQQKYRESLTGKSQYNFILSDKAAATLDKLSDHYEISRAKIIEILLDMEADKNIYIPEKIRILKLLNSSN